MDKTLLLMDEQHETQLWQNYTEARDIKSRDGLFALYKRWAEIEACRLYGQLSIAAAEQQEFEQWAYQGMLEAIERFDPTLNISFKAFAIHRVRGAIFTALPQLSEASAYYAKRGKFQQAQLTPSAQVVDNNTGEPLSMLISLVMELSVDFLLHDPDNDLTQLTGEYYSSPEINTIGQRIRDNVETLDDPMRTIIKLYYFEELSFDKIAQLVELSNGRVSQLHKKAMASLKQRVGW
jgi:RNA polymerase sigma factor for flagellar operon FliA